MKDQIMKWLFLVAADAVKVYAAEHGVTPEELGALKAIALKIKTAKKASAATEG